MSYGTEIRKSSVIMATDKYFYRKIMPDFNKGKSHLKARTKSHLPFLAGVHKNLVRQKYQVGLVTRISCNKQRENMLSYVLTQGTYI